MIATGLLGVAIEPERIRLVLIDAHGIRCTLDAQWHARDESVRDALLRSLSRLPRDVRTPRRAILLLDPTFVQIRELAGFPWVRDAARRAMLLQEGAHRWFLRRTGGLLTAGPVPDGVGLHWGCAYERSVVDDARGALLTAKIDVQVVASRDPVQAGTRDHTPADDQDDAEMLAGRVRQLAREADGFSLSPIAGGSLARASRARAAAVGLMVAAVIAALSYPLGLWVTASRLEGALETARPRLMELSPLQDSLSAGSSALAAIESRRETRISWITRLASLTAVLPDGTAATSLHADSTRGVLVVTGPRAGSIVDLLERVDGFGSPQLLSPVTTERLGERTLERAALSFALISSRRTP